MMDSLKKYIRLGAIAGFLMTVLVSCSEDSLNFQEPSAEEGIPGGITFRCSDMLETFVGDNNPAGTRAAAAKNPEEKAIKTLHIFFFNYATGELVDVDQYANFPAYQKISNSNFIKIPTGKADSDNNEENEKFEQFKEKFSNVRIVAIANIDATDEADDAGSEANKFKTKYSTGGKIQLKGRAKGGQPYEITKYSELQDWVYYPRIRMNEDGTGNISALPEAGMPMIGELVGWDSERNKETGINLSTKPQETLVVNMTALMAKVNVSVKLDPDQFTEEFPLLKITGYGVRNMPIAVPFKQREGRVNPGKTKGKPTSYQDYFDRYDVTDVPMFHKDGIYPKDPTNDVCKDSIHEFLSPANVIINKDSKAQTFSYYTYENINLPDYNAKRVNGEDAFNNSLEPQYPPYISAKDNAEKQRWKSTFAYSDRASALILKGEYTTHQGLKYNAQFTVYMGCTVGVEDPNIDFMVKRNHQYDNNIVIHGLDYIRNSDDGVFNFDGRVNVVDDNPLYLAIVNERKVDAHATALPMDVWFMLREDGNGNVDDVPWNSEVTFTIRDHDNKKGNWLRMEKVTRAEMEAGREINGKRVSFAFGTGARDYFTTNLVKETIKNKGSYKSNGFDREYGPEITVDGDKDGSRSRIYFYIDENVPTSNFPSSDPNASNYYGDRTATIDIHYVRKDAEGNVIDTRDRTLEIKQKALLRVGGTHEISGKKIPITWIEYYEEYLEHNDPLDKHENPGELYSGLVWGLYGVNTYYSRFHTSGFNNPEDGGDANHVYYSTGAFPMTQWAINKMGSTSLRDVHLFNDVAPKSAFHYCYGRNKRNSSGDASLSGSAGWYMPGIRELEKALLDYYGLFNDEFSKNFYWSASGNDKTAWSDGEIARATKIIVTGNTYNYAQSLENKDPGYQDRGSINRIRAFYRINDNDTD